mmetsp:Transcript_33817/g.78200  ORF Transcript_33817/g.78200 Transcript_33817/m.78200 type:complete len:233 (+) Transcript_33817:2220-2918(+)
MFCTQLEPLQHVLRHGPAGPTGTALPPADLAKYLFPKPSAADSSPKSKQLGSFHSDRRRGDPPGHKQRHGQLLCTTPLDVPDGHASLPACARVPAVPLHRLCFPSRPKHTRLRHPSDPLRQRFVARSWLVGIVQGPRSTLPTQSATPSGFSVALQLAESPPLFVGTPSCSIPAPAANHVDSPSRSLFRAAPAEMSSGASGRHQTDSPPAPKSCHHQISAPGHGGPRVDSPAE